MLTVTRLGLPPELRSSLACTSIIENVMGTFRGDVPINVEKGGAALLALSR
jgi:putative transposase